MSDGDQKLGLSASVAMGPTFGSMGRSRQLVNMDPAENEADGCYMIQKTVNQLQKMAVYENFTHLFKE